MRIENRCLLGTINEIAAAITQSLCENGYVTLNGLEKWRNCTFAIADANTKEESSLSEYVINSEGWYGIHKVNTGFDNTESLDLFADYYGGGCGCYQNICDGISEESVQGMIEDMIVYVLNIQETGFDRGTMLILEYKN